MKNMSLLRRLLLGIPVTIAAAAGAVLLFPSLVLLVTPGLHVRSAYCSTFKAAEDFHVKQEQMAATDRIAKASRLVRRDGNLALWNTPAGAFWVPAGDDQIVALLLAQEERNIYGTDDFGVQPGDLVLDVGAYIGTWTKQALARGAKQVIAIEPSPDSIECLRRNLTAEVASGKVVIYPKGIWDSEGALPFFSNGPSGVGNSFVERGDAATAVGSIPVTTIDKLAAELHLAEVDFIKADVKGATERLLRGGAEVIRRDRPRIAVSTEEPVDDPGPVARTLQSILPAYAVKAGPCLVSGHDVYTDVMFFR